MRRSVGVRSGDGYHSTTTCPGAVNGQNAAASHVRDSHPRMLPESHVSRPVRRLKFDLAPLLRSELPWLDANRVRNCCRTESRRVCRRSFRASGATISEAERPSANHFRHDLPSHGTASSFLPTASQQGVRPPEALPPHHSSPDVGVLARSSTKQTNRLYASRRFTSRRLRRATDTWRVSVKQVRAQAVPGVSAPGKSRADRRRHFLRGWTR